MHVCREQGQQPVAGFTDCAQRRASPGALVHQRRVSCEPRRTALSSASSSEPGAFLTAFGAIALRQRASKEGGECVSLCSSVCRGSGHVRPPCGARPGLASSGDSQPRGLVGPQRVPPPVTGCEALPPGMAAELARLWRGCGVAVSWPAGWGGVRCGTARVHRTPCLAAQPLACPRSRSPCHSRGALAT